MVAPAPRGTHSARGRMRVIFFGTAEFAVPSLEQVAAHHAVVTCVTQPDRPQGRGLKPTPSPVKQAALRLKLPLSQPEQSHVNLYETLHPDVGVVAAYGQLIREELLALPTHGMLGVHPSLLPQYRGAAPVAWALLKGETTTGMTIFRMNERLDAGDIALQRTVEIQPDEDAHELTGRLARLGAQAVVDTLEGLAAGQIRFETQDESRATLAPKLTKAQGRIDWTASARTIERLVRATVPWPGASTSWRGGSLKILEAVVGASGVGRATPGSIIQVAEGRVTVATGEGTLEIREVQPAGRRRMAVKEFLAGHRLHVGERFGADDK